MIRATIITLLFAVPASAHEVLPASDGEFLTSWYVAGPVRAKAGPPTNGAWQPLIGATHEVDAGKKRRPGKRQATWFRLQLRSSKAHTLHLKLGSDGAAQVLLNGKPLTRHERAHYMLWDDHIHRFDLAPGTHELLIKTTRKEKQKNSGWKIVCRIQDAASSRVPDGLTFHLPGLSEVDLHRAQAATLKTQRSLTKTGYRLKIGVQVSGSTPVGAQPGWTATLKGRAEPVATGVIGAKPVTVDLKLPRDQEYQLNVVSAGRKWVVPFIFKRQWNSGLLQARADFVKADRSKQTVATLDSVEYNLRKLEGLVLDSIPDHKWLSQQIRLVGSWAAALAEGRDPLAKRRGDFYRSYRSRFDGNLQPFSVHVPKRYDGSKGWPLVIGMHGIGSGTHYTLRRVLGKDRDYAREPNGKPLIRGNMPRLPDYGVLTATAWGYHNSAFWFYGEDDVMRVIDEMKAAYNVDPDRVYLTGLSLGGLGTYHIGHHYPDTFAALGPLGGFSSIKLYRQIRRHKKTPWEKVLIEQRDATTYAENGRHTPMRVVHGIRDAPRHAKAMTERYEKLGYRYELEIPDLGHDVWQHSYGEGALVKWMKRFKRPTNPDEIVFKTHAYRYTRAYWAKVGWIGDYTKPALLRLKIDKRDRSRIVIRQADNLRGLTLDLTRPKLAKAPITLVFKQTKTKLTVPEKAVVKLRREGDGPWRLAKSADPPPGHKRPGMSGPIDDIMYEPHTFVVGTSDPAQTDANRRLISEDHTYLRHRNHDIWFPIADDVDVTDAELRSKNLVLYGNARSNAVVAKILATGKVPLRFEDNAIVVGDRRFEGEDVGVKLIYPNPFNPDNMVVICAGVTWQGTLLSRHLPRHVPDVIVYDKRINTRYHTRILIDRPVLFGAFFNSDWSLPN